MTVKCFHVSATINHDVVYEARYRRSHDVRNWLKACLKDPEVTSVGVTIIRAERDPVENTAS